jgi:eukaryotic-like serine/threonine-protein kinase
MNIDVGHILAGKYELAQLLGRGAMGEVWLAHHVTLGGEFAVKLMEPADESAFEAASRFQLEAQIAAKLARRTRHIVSVSDHGEEDGIAYLVMERLEGESLENRVTRKGPVPVAEVAALLAQVSRALVLAHDEGFLHRDLKPANLWLGRDEDGKMLAKILDFGIARSMKPFRTRSPHVTSKDSVLGTPSYMSPEQARGLPGLDHRCDLWALCVSAYEALTGELPFNGQTVEDVFLQICTFKWTPIRQRRPELPLELEDFFARAFASNVDERFSNARELATAFAVAAGVPPPAIQPPPDLSIPPPARVSPTSSPEVETDVDMTIVKPRRRPGLVAFASVVVIALAGAGLALFFRSPGASADPSPAKLVPTPEPSFAAIPPPEPPPVREDPVPTAEPPTAQPSARAPVAPRSRPAPPPPSLPPRTAGAKPEEAKPAVAPPAAPAPSPAPTPAPAKPIDKSAVF